MINHTACYAKLGEAYRCAWENEETSQEADEAEQIVENEKSSDASEELCSCGHLYIVYVV